MPPHRPAALAGLKVLDMTRVIAGPLAAQTLADLGAEVVKVERLEGGDDFRTLGPPWLPNADGTPSEEATYFQSVNRGKRSLGLDFSRPEGAAILRRLVQQADVLLENFRPGTLARYGLDYASLAALNPRLVYCSITGFGQNGPYRDRSGYDYLVQGMAGLMEYTGWPDGEPGGGPMRIGVPLGDVAAAQNAVIGILAALRHRDASGQGQQIDIALFDTQFNMLLHPATAWLNARHTVPRTGNAHATAVPCGVFDAADGRLLIVAFNDREFARLAVALGQPGWAEDARFARSRDRVTHRDALYAEMQATLGALPRQRALELLLAARISAGPINAMAELEDDPQVAARGLVVELARENGQRVRVIGSPLHLSATPVAYDRAPPLPGEHSDAVLQDWAGMDPAAIAAARRDGVI